MALLTLLAVVTLGIIRLRNLFGVVMLASIYSFLMATLLVALDAVDVAMTEAAVGAGISTVLLLAVLHLTKSTEAPGRGRDLVALALTLVIGAALVWGTLALPSFGSAEAVIHHHVAPRYIADSLRETMVPNLVTAVLADWRGYDTLGETTVIFTAGIGVMLLLRGMRRRDQGRGADARAGTHGGGE